MSSRGGARPGAGRKAQDPGTKRRRLSTTISNASWQALQELANQAGTSISQTLDALIAGAGERADAALQGSVPAAAATNAAKVLLLESDPASLGELQGRLETLGCQVLAAGDVEQAFELAVAELPALVVMGLATKSNKEAHRGLIERLVTLLQRQSDAFPDTTEVIIR